MLFVQKVIQLWVPTSHVKEGLVNYGHCLVEGFMPKETFCTKGVRHCHFFMCAHVLSYCSCGDIVLFIAEDTSSRSCYASFFSFSFLQKWFFEPKREGKKMFCYQIVFIHLRICIHMYTNISICIISLFF